MVFRSNIFFILLKNLPKKSFLQTTTLSSLQIASLFDGQLPHLNYTATSTTTMDFFSYLFFFYPFLCRIIFIDILPHKKIIPDSWKPAKIALIVVYRQDSPWLVHSIYVLVNYMVPCNRHSFICELLFSNLKLNILLPSISFHGWRSCFNNIILLLWINSSLLCGICTFVLRLIVAHNYNYTQTLDLIE